MVDLVNFVCLQLLYNQSPFSQRCFLNQSANPLTKSLTPLRLPMSLQFLPLFPINVVVFPTEKVNLHIFEPRYKRLINECRQTGMSFGMPVYINGKVGEYGTEIRLLQIIKTHPDGEMDIQTEGVRIFKLHEFMARTEHLYPGGQVEWLEEVDDHNEKIQLHIIQQIQQLYKAWAFANRLTTSAATPLPTTLGCRLSKNISCCNSAKKASGNCYCSNICAKLFPW